ncbi:MAG: DNA alkylation repair protein [Chitinophagaceae bacterium]|nr:DNA alkylation repair protein [Chitinophagaceae bacterium]
MPKDNHTKDLRKEAKLTAKLFVEKLSGFQSKTELEKNQRFFRDADSSGNKFFGVRWLVVFKLAKEFTGMDLKEIEKLLDSKFYEVRMGAVSIMDFQARNKKTTEDRKKELFDLYIRRHDSINNWDLVDRSAPYVVGGYLSDKPRKILYKLATSKNPWERRTAIVSTYFFIRQGDINDTFKIAEILVNDEHDLIQKAVGSWIREAGKKDKQKLIDFLDKFSVKMPRVMLRYAIEKFDKKQREFYLNIE